MKCNAECEIWSRIVGYLRPVKNWNRGKREEFRERVPYKITPFTDGVKIPKPKLPLPPKIR